VEDIIKRLSRIISTLDFQKQRIRDTIVFKSGYDELIKRGISAEEILNLSSEYMVKDGNQIESVRELIQANIDWARNIKRKAIANIDNVLEEANNTVKKVFVYEPNEYALDIKRQLSDG
jgi:hypothetical protein